MDFSHAFSSLAASGPFVAIDDIMKICIEKSSQYLSIYFQNKTASADNIVQAFYSDSGNIAWSPLQKKEIFRQLALLHWNGLD